MKWIGQHIWDFISRFRSDVYLEATETGTIASGGNLGLDSNNKIVKADTESGELSFDGSTANGVLTYKDADEISVESSWTFDGTNQVMGIVSSTAQAPSIMLENSEGGTTDPYILFKRSGSSPADGDNIGSFLFTSKNSNDELINFARIVTKISEVTDTDEAGKMELQVACSDGNNTSGSPLVTGLTLEGEHNTGGEIDATIGAGAASTTTIAGTLTMGSTAFVNNSGVVQVATQGTIDHDSLANFVAAEHVAWGNGGTGTIHPSNIPTLNQDTTGTAATVTGAAQTNVTSLGTLTNLDVDNININGDTITASADLSIVATGNDIAVDTDNFTIESSGTLKPSFTLKATSSGNKPPEFNFVKDKGAAGADSDTISLINFISDNDAQEQVQFADIITQVRLAADGAEEGRFAINIKNTDHAISPKESFALVANGAATDATIGYGTTSMTTIAGGTTLTKTATLLNNNPLAFNDLDNSHKVDLRGPATQADNRAIALPDADGTVQLQGENTGQVVHVQIKDFGNYLFYLYHDDNWYSAGSTTLAILGSSTAPGNLSSDNSKYQGRIASYTAPSACTLKKLCFSFYWSSSIVDAADFDFGFSKYTPITDGTAATITMNAISATDHNGAHTENAPYYHTFTFAGGSSSLSAGDSFAFHMRTTGATTSTQRVLVYGQATLYLELD